MPEYAPPHLFLLTSTSALMCQNSVICIAFGEKKTKHYIVNSLHTCKAIPFTWENITSAKLPQILLCYCCFKVPA